MSLLGAQQALPFFLLISAQIKGFRLRWRALQFQTLFVPARKGNTAPARIARHVLSTRPVALALELCRWVSGLSGERAPWLGRKNWG